MQERIPSENKNFSFSIPLEDFMCPITTQIFFEPTQGMPCGHMFEMEAIHEWRKSSDACPCCRQTIDVIYPAPSYFNKLFKEFLEKNPSLQNERYFNFQTFEKAFHDNTNLQSYIKLFKVASKQLNTPSEEKESKGMTPVALLAKHEKGFQFFMRESKLVNNITEEGLNTIIQTDEDAGIAALYWFTTMKNLKLLQHDEKLCSKITSTGLNSIFREGVLQGRSPLFELTATISGRKLLKDNPALRAKITSAGLNHIVQGESRVGENALNNLVCEDDGIAILLEDAALREKITPAGLNSYVLLGNNAGVTGTSWLILSEIGIELLKNDENLRKKITADGINIPEQGSDKGASGIYWLLSSTTGREIFRKDKRLRSLVTEEALHRKVAEGHNEGLSPAYWLESYCQDILINDYDFKMKFNREERFSLDNFFKDSKSKMPDLEFRLDDRKEDISLISVRRRT